MIRARAAQNRFIGIEELTEDELKEIRAVRELRGKTARADEIENAADAAEDRANEKARKAAARFER